MRIKTLFLFLILLITLSGCNGSKEDLIAELDDNTSVDVVETFPTETPMTEPTVEATVQSLAEESSDVSEPQVTAPALASECTLVSSLPDPPQEYAELLTVMEDDWVIGPDDAAITLIEYGDYQ